LELKQIAELRTEMLTTRADTSACMERMETTQNRMTELDGRLSTMADKLTTHCATLEDKVADLEDRSRRDNLRILGIPENPETANPLVYLLDAIPKWFPEMGSIEIMRAHRVGPAKEDANHKPIPRPVLLKLLRFTDRDKILGAARKTMVKLDGSPVRFVPDYSTRTFRRRLAFSNAIGALQKLGFHTFLLYPAKLKVMRGGTTHIFDTPQMLDLYHLINNYIKW
uniref:L1 transposable element RRM domain-containing protein n=1 Tax=Kryptolebias marmoratus TaxID=37003 RepID=A0A3Q2ZSZ5_KRYMA